MTEAVIKELSSDSPELSEFHKELLEHVEGARQDEPEQDEPVLR